MKRLDIFKAAERLMGMDDEAWARHANPWSVFTRFTCLPLIVLAIWSRVWIGWWAPMPLALDRLPISLVAAIEFVGTIGIALWGLLTGRNYLAFAFAIIGVALLIDVPSLLAADGPELTSDLLGLFWAVLNGSLFVLYIILGHKISEGGASGGVERLDRPRPRSLDVQRTTFCARNTLFFRRID